MELVFDIETNGFLDVLDTIHSLVIHDRTSGRRWSCTDRPDYQPTPGYELINIEEGVSLLMKADYLIGHNIIQFDIPAIQKVYPWFSAPEERVCDTLVMSRLIWSNLLDVDMKKIRANKTPLTMKYAGLHGLEAWGIRLGEWKGDYSKMMEEKGLDPWETWNAEMQRYCEQDVVVNNKLYALIQRKDVSEQAVQLEHQVAFIIAQVERNGYAFNVKKAEELLVTLTKARADMAEKLRDVFPPWVVPDGDIFIPKRPNKKLGYCGHTDPETKKFTGYPSQKIKINVFNPNSRDQIADRLQKVHGWKPTEFTPKGRPKIDDDILGDLKYPEAKILAEYMAMGKILGMLAEGDNAWLKLVTPAGRIHGGINPNGAVTGRATHSRPNIGQVPSVKKPFGAECRELFGKPYQLGCDVSGLELRMLGHFMAKFDDGEYAREVVEGDVHTTNQEAAGLPDRDTAKTFIYAFLYGAGNQKIGSIVGRGAKAGATLKQRFFSKVPALKKLSTGVQAAAKKTGSLRGLDGRKLHIRSTHAALNTLLQSAGALVCKQWIVEFVKLLKEHDLYQTKVRIVTWVHDELQMEIADELVSKDADANLTSIVGDLCVQAIRNAGDHFDIRVPLDGEYKIGNNWKDCH